MLTFKLPVLALPGKWSIVRHLPVISEIHYIQAVHYEVTLTSMTGKSMECAIAWKTFRPILQRWVFLWWLWLNLWEVVFDNIVFKLYKFQHFLASPTKLTQKPINNSSKNLFIVFFLYCIFVKKNRNSSNAQMKNIGCNQYSVHLFKNQKPKK